MALRLPKDFEFRDCRSATIDAAFAETLGIRLGAVASFVQQGATVLDIGTDHGRLPIGLVKSGRARSVIASDVNRGPIVNAQKSVALECVDVASKINVRFGDGLAVLKDGDDIDTVTISGIGGVTIARILFGPSGVYPDSDVAVTEWSRGRDMNSNRVEQGQRHENKFVTVNDLCVQQLVLQPTSGWPSLRRTLLCQGWDIVDECIHSEVCVCACVCVCGGGRVEDEC
jgi:tRNA A22 N-methylase